MLKKNYENLAVGVMKREWLDPGTNETNIFWEMKDTDLIFYPEIVMDFLDYTARGKVPEEILDVLGTTKEEIAQAAIRNMEEDAVVQKMSDMFGPSVFQGVPMVILTNKEGTRGAGVIASTKVLREAQELLEGEDLYVIPSSIHECLAVPASMVTSKEDLEEVIQEINDSVVEPVDRLSDHPYYFDGEMLRTA